MADRLEAGRRAFARRAWKEAHRTLSAALDELDAADLERLAIASYLIGDDDGTVAALERSHRLHLEAGEAADAARSAFWLSLNLLLRGETAQAGGWLARAEQVVAVAGECAASGYLLVPATIEALEGGDIATAEKLAVRTIELGRRYGDADVVAFGLLSHGEALIAAREAEQGIARLDEVMLSVTAGDVGPITSGIVYCAVLLECMKLFDFARASEWTRALAAWCDSQPDLVPYRGQCLVHRSQLEQAAGNWPDAVVIVRQACERLTDPPHPAVGMAFYQTGELHRLVGAFDDALVAYREANRSGYQPLPGLALLELARGEPDAAAATIRRALQETADATQRPGLLAAAVDVRLAAGDVPGARQAAEELGDVAAGSGSTALHAMAADATGAVLLEEGDPAGALAQLRAAAAAWRRLRMPYEAARTAVALGRACAALGDRASAVLEFDGAEAAFADLGAAPALERLQTVVASLVAPGEPGERAGRSPLSEREREVLAQVAAGKTNRQIATALSISEHTVGRHLENMFAKLGVTSRAAATAYAYEHGLL
jgi:DNA-binding CsgD family transcriptional regulator